MIKAYKITEFTIREIRKSLLKNDPMAVKTSDFGINQFTPLENIRMHAWFDIVKKKKEEKK